MSNRPFLLILSAMMFGIFQVHAAGDGMLTVKTQPEGVEVWLDDNYIGDTPVINKRLKPGKYSVKLIDAIRHTSSTEEVFIQAGEITLVEKTMKNKFGSLMVNSQPEGADVYVLMPLGKTPLNNEYMKPGKYRLEIRHPNSLYNITTEDINIPEGEKVDISQTLETKEIFDRKALVRIGLGLGAIVGFAYGIYEQGNYKELKKEDDLLNNDLEDDIQMSSLKRTLGIVVGSLCVIGFEVVAFF